MDVLDGGEVAFDVPKSSYLPGEDVNVVLNIQKAIESTDAFIGLFRDGSDVSDAIILKSLPTDQVLKGVFPCLCELHFKLPLAKTRDSGENEYFEFRLICGGKCIAASSKVSVNWVAEAESFMNFEDSEVTSSNDSSSFVLVDSGSSEFSVIKNSPFYDSAHSVDGFTLARSSYSDPELPKHSSDILSTEITRRIQAENAVEELSRRMSKQLVMISASQEDVMKLTIGYEREKAIKESLKEEIESSQQNRSHEIDKLKALVVSYRSECETLQDKIEDGKDLIDRLKMKIIEDRDLHEEEVNKLKAEFKSSVTRYDDAMEELATSLAAEKNKSAEFEKEVEKFMQLSEEIRTGASTVIEEMKLENKRLQGLIDEERSSHEKAMLEQEKNFQILESRLANDSSRASGLENDLRVLELKLRHAEENGIRNDTKYQESERRLQETQHMLNMAREELNNMKNILVVQECNTPQDCTSSSKATETDRDFAGDETSEAATVACTSDQITATSSDPGIEAATIEDDGSLNNISLDKQSAELFRIGRNNADQRAKPRKRNQDQNALQHIPVVGTLRSPKKFTTLLSSRDAISAHARTDAVPDFSADISVIDREALEKQYSAIRLHRNALIRENGFLRNKLKLNNHDVATLRTMLQNVILEAEHRIGMLEVALVRKVDKEAFGNGSSPELQHLSLSDELVAQDAADEKAEAAASLSPYAIEYVPSSANFAAQEAIAAQLNSYLSATNLPTYYNLFAQQTEQSYYTQWALQQLLVAQHLQQQQQQQQQQPQQQQQHQQQQTHHQTGQVAYTTYANRASNFIK